MLPRTDVTKSINAYIKEHKTKNGREIFPDETLTKLLKIPKGDELTFFNLQKYMSPHFAKASATTA